MNRTTHTYAVLEISTSSYREIRNLLDAAGYQHAFHRTASATVNRSGLDVAAVEVIDMHGIALAGNRAESSPIPMILACPRCHLQHIDVDDETGKWATSRHHRKHLCKKADGGCGLIFAPANVHTVGVKELPEVASMNNILREALYSLNWGAAQSEQSTSLSPEQCRALLDYIRELKSKGERVLFEETAEVQA